MGNKERSKTGSKGYEDGKRNKYRPPSGGILDAIQDSLMGTDNQRRSSENRKIYDKNWSKGYKGR